MPNKFLLYITFLFVFIALETSCKKKKGCIDPTASNFDIDAEEDDGSCQYWGCMDSSASNYDPIATIDDGNCIYLPTGFSFEGSYSNIGGNSPVFTLSSINAEIEIEQNNIFNEIQDNKVKITANKVSIFDLGNHEITSIKVNEWRNDRWVEDQDFLSDYKDVTKVALVIVIQKSPSGFEGELVYERIVSFSQHLLDIFLTFPNIEFSIALVDYGDNYSILKEFDGTILNSSSITDFKQSITSIVHSPNEANSLSASIMAGVDLLSDFPSEAQHKGIFIFGDGKDNVSGDVTNVISYLESKNIKDVYCVGIERDANPTFPTDGEENFSLLAQAGNGYFRRVNIKSKVNELYDNYYIDVPNMYELSYTRSGLGTNEPIMLQWNLTSKLKE